MEADPLWRFALIPSTGQTPDGLGFMAANRAGNCRWLLTCTVQGQVARRLVVMTRCGDAIPGLRAPGNNLQPEG